MCIFGVKNIIELSREKKLQKMCKVQSEIDLLIKEIPQRWYKKTILYTETVKVNTYNTYNTFVTVNMQGTFPKI